MARHLVACEVRPAMRDDRLLGHALMPVKSGQRIYRVPCGAPFADPAERMACNSDIIHVALWTVAPFPHLTR